MVAEFSSPEQGKELQRSNRRLEPERKKRASAASGGGPHAVGGATPDASVSELSAGPRRAGAVVEARSAATAGGESRGPGAEPRAGVTGAEPPAWLSKNNSSQDGGSGVVVPFRLQRELSVSGGRKAWGPPQYPPSGKTGAPLSEMGITPLSPPSGKTGAPLKDAWKYSRSTQACLSKAWHFRCWPRKSTDNSEAQNSVFRCKSFRCPECSKSVARSDYFRINEALKKKPRWAYLVLTVDPRNFRNHADAYLGICRSFELLRNRMKRKYGEVIYIRTVEEHKSKFPHMNVLFYCEKLFELYPDDVELGKWLKRWLTPQSRQCGFGYIHHLEYGKSDKALAEYIAKSSMNILSAEVSKRSQVPLNAPKNFRRLGATRGLLPPRMKSDGTWTGILIRSPLLENPLTSESSESIISVS